MPAKKLSPKAKPRRRPAFRALAAYVFNPNSFDSQFASLHTTLTEQNESRNARMDTQDGVLEEIKKQVQATNGRVTKLESKWKVAAAWATGCAAALTFAIQFLFHIWKK